MTQNARLLTYLQSNDGITTLEATLHFGICRLSERIRELEELQYHFTRSKEKTANGASVVRYRLARAAPVCTASDYLRMRG